MGKNSHYEKAVRNNFGVIFIYLYKNGFQMRGNRFTLEKCNV